MFHSITVLITIIIGGISKTDLKRFIAYAQHNFNLPILESFLNATPTAELGKSLSIPIFQFMTFRIVANIRTCHQSLFQTLTYNPTK